MKKNGQRPPLCSECKKADVVEGGYYVNVSQLFKYMAATVVEAGEQYEEENFERHLCGKACLMQCLNAEVDRISSMSAHNPLWEVEA